MNNNDLEALEFVLNATARLPEGCTCGYAATETLGLVQYVWDEDCQVHGLPQEDQGHA